MAMRPSRRKVLAAAAVFLLVVLVPPWIRLNMLRARITGAISGAMGQPVSVRDVGLQLLPQPGLTLSGFVVQDDPAISAEPMLRADEVVARPRLSSLWRGRLEIATLSLKDPSLNLVRATNRHWNLEALLNRATHIPTAPTAKARPEARPRFPYIEASGARINFKFGQEKKVYAFTDSDFALWLESEDLWNMRLAGKVVRTDANLTDTGRVQLSGYFRRTERLRDTPLNVRLALEGAQLGQLTQLIYGRDRGWRGTVNVSATLAGTPAALQVTTDAAVDDFRRYDILSGEALSLAAHCTGKFEIDAAAFSGVECVSPQQQGQVAAHGSLSAMTSERNYDLTVTARAVPASALAKLARHAKRGLPEDLEADGTVDAEFLLRSSGDPGQRSATWSGGGAATDFILHSRGLDPALEIGEIKFALNSAAPPSQRARGITQVRPGGLLVGPFAVPLGSSSAARVYATVSRTGYDVDVHGDAALERLLGVVRALGGRAPQFKTSGAVTLDLAVAGQWSGFAAPISTGSIALRNVLAQFPGVNAPLRVKSAHMLLTPELIEVQKLAASFTGGPTELGGSFVFPRACTTLESCPVRLDVHADELSSEELNRLFNPLLRKRRWYQIAVAEAPSRWRDLRLSGRIAADRFTMRKVTASQVSAQMELAGGKLRLSSLRAQILGGSLGGNWIADFTGSAPVYTALGQIERGSLQRIAQLMHDDWASGTVAGTYRVSASGWTEPELLASTEAVMDFTWSDGILRHIALNGSGAPLRLRRFSGTAQWHDGRLEFKPSRMETPDGIYVISGTAGQQLNLKLQTRDAHAYTISGTLEKPHVTSLPTSETQVSEAR